MCVVDSRAEGTKWFVLAFLFRGSGEKTFGQLSGIPTEKFEV